jgi:chromosome segregation ATPase
MSRKYRIDKPLDDYVILNNLDVFKAQITAQSQFCDDAQHEIRQLNDKLSKREKKYQCVKSDYKNLLSKCQQLENDNSSLKSQLEVYKLLLSNQFSNLNGHMLNNFNTIPNPPPPPQVTKINNISDISLGTQNKLPKRMDNVLDELRFKIKRIE